MQLKHILNQVEKQKGFVYQSAPFCKHKETILIGIGPRSGSRPICDGCGKKGPGYDSMPARRFEFVPLWGIVVYSYRLFLATWAKRLSWKETAIVFGTSWDTIYRSIRWVVRWG